MNMAEKSDFQFFFKLLHALYYCPSNITWAVDTSLAAQKLLDLSPLCCFKERMVFFVFFCLSKGFFCFSVCHTECQKECQRKCQKVCQIACQKTCEIECRRTVYARKNIRKTKSIYIYICRICFHMIFQKLCQNSVSGCDHSK